MQQQINVELIKIITGMSMGGYGTWDAFARWPERFVAAGRRL